MKVFKAPHRDETKAPIKIFLAGSIEMGVAEDWQTRVTNELKKYDVVLYNPRRDDWDSSWKQDPTKGTDFHEQVEWEWDHIKEADLVLFYFDEKTKSPITLLELGYALGIKKDILVFCPQKFFRYGNVAMVMGMEDKADNLFIDEDSWFAEVDTVLAVHKILEESEIITDEVLDEIVTEESVDKNKVTINVLQEAKDSSVTEYVKSKHLKEQ